MDIARIFGLAGSGKTERIAVTTMALLTNLNIKTVYGSAPTHVIISGLTVRLDRVST